MRYVAGLFTGVVGGPSSVVGSTPYRIRTRRRSSKGSKHHTYRAKFGARCEMGKIGRKGGGGAEGGWWMLTEQASQPESKEEAGTTDYSILTY